MSTSCAVDIVKCILFKILNRSGPIWVGGEALQAQPAQVLSWVAFATSLSITVLVCAILSQHACTVLRLLKHHFHSNILAKKGKNTTPCKSFHLKCSRKCLIQPCVHLDSPIIHLCIFSKGQTAESSWYHIHFWASVPASEKGKGIQGSREASQETSHSSTIYSGVCLCMCLLLYPGYLPPQKKGIQ